MAFPKLTSPKSIATAIYNVTLSQILDLYLRNHQKLIETTPKAVSIAFDLTPPNEYLGSFPLTALNAYRAVFVGAKGKRERKRLSVICTYAITCSKTSKVYVGSTSDFFGRWNKHVWELTKGVHTNDHLQALFDKHPDSLSISILQQYTSTDGLEVRERSDAARFDPAMLLNYRVGHAMNGDWYPTQNAGRWSHRPPMKKRGPNSKSRWFDGTSIRKVRA